MHWTPETLAAVTGGRIVRRSNRPIAGAFIDARIPVSGGIFVPIVANRDGHDFMAQAIEGGAGAILLASDRTAPAGDVTLIEVQQPERAFVALAAARRDAFTGPVVAISGSNGKTTTRALVAAALSTRGPVLQTAGNLNNHLGVPLTLLGPPAHPWAMVIELGMSAPGENDRLAALVRPTVHVITSVALEHLASMHSLDAIAEAEAEPVHHVPADGLVVIPADEPHVRRDWFDPAGPRIATIASGTPADVTILEATVGVRTRGRLRLRDGAQLDVALKLFGIHNVRNAAMAIAVGDALGLAREPMIAALAEVEPVGDRGRMIDWGDHLVVADCYNANPGSVAAALGSLAAFQRDGRAGPKIAVLGDMLELGETSPSLHAEAGRLAVESCDALVGIGPQSRHAVAVALEQGHRAVHLSDVDAAATWITKYMQDQPPGVVLIKGSRGMRLERLIARLVARDEKDSHLRSLDE